jgi:hypothetical protein
MATANNAEEMSSFRNIWAPKNDFLKVRYCNSRMS